MIRTRPKIRKESFNQVWNRLTELERKNYAMMGYDLIMELSSNERKRNRLFNIRFPDSEHIFDVIRKESKFCSRCGGKLDLSYTDFHIPFCVECREKPIQKKLEEAKQNLAKL